MGSFETITTDSAEVHYVVFDFSSKTGTGNNVYMVDRIHFQIKDACAFSAEEMIVWRRVAIEVVKTVSAVQTQCFTMFYKKTKVTVYGAETDIWKFCS